MALSQKWLTTGAFWLAIVGTNGVFSPQAQAQQQRFDQHTVSSDAAKKTAPPEVFKSITDEQRRAVTFTAYDLDVHLNPQQHTLSVHAHVSLRNDGSQPMAAIPVQLSSALDFDDAAADGKHLAFAQQTINSDVDHTGQLHEAAVVPTEPLAPKASTTLDIFYSGTIEPSARRLEQLGTPPEIAAHTDWDQISADFVGLRGFGNVVWYPVSSAPALLGDGAKVFTEIAEQKSRQANTKLHMRVTAEFYDVAPTVAVLSGHVIPITKPDAAPSGATPGVVTCEFGPEPLGIDLPTLFLTTHALHEEGGLGIYARSEDTPAIGEYTTAASMVRPILEPWLGAKPKSDLTIIDLPEANDAPFEQGTALMTSLAPEKPDELAPQLAHALAHTYFQSPRGWLNEGVATFAGTLWIEHAHDRTTALQAMEMNRGALALAEPATPGAAAGQDLLHASDAIYFRTKAAYVLWMLRDVTSDDKLGAALQAYEPAKDTTPEYFESLLERPRGVNPAQDLQWFFKNWVYNDRGLPDLTIAAVHPSLAQNGEYLVGIDILNDGFAEVEVPVTVRSQNSTLTERVRLPGKTRTTHRMLVQGAPQELTVNDGAVPEVQATIHTRTLADQASQ